MPPPSPEEKEFEYETPPVIAIRLFQDDKLLQAARILRTSFDLEEVTCSKQRSTIVQHADACEKLVDIFKSDAENPENGWSKVDGGRGKKSHGDTKVYYKTNANCTRLECRLETPIDESLLIPIISVLNESQLYHTWMPSWNIPPRFGIRRVKKLKQVGRCSQVIIGKVI